MKHRVQRVERGAGAGVIDAVPSMAGLFKAMAQGVTELPDSWQPFLDQFREMAKRAEAERGKDIEPWPSYAGPIPDGKNGGTSEGSRA